MSLENQVVLVTGAARRLGKAIAQTLAQAGMRVLVHYHRSRDEAYALAHDLGNHALALQADLRVPEQVHALFARIQKQVGTLDHVVNNASVFQKKPFVQMDDSLWEEMLRVNLTAPQQCIRQAVPLGLRSVVNMLDIAAWQPWKAYGAYSTTKAGLLQLTRVLARELAPQVRVNAVAPGLISFPEDPLADVAQRLAHIPLQRLGQPDEVARAVRFLLAEDYLTGVCIPVDGGQGLR